MGNIDEPEKIQSWTAKRKHALALAILKGEVSVAETASRNW